MLDFPLPERAALQPELVLRVDTIRKLQKLSDRDVDVACDFSRGTLSRLRAGEGARYDTVQKLTSWVSDREGEIAEAGGTLSIPHNHR